MADANAARLFNRLMAPPFLLCFAILWRRTGTRFPDGKIHHILRQSQRFWTVRLCCRGCSGAVEMALLIFGSGLTVGWGGTVAQSVVEAAQQSAVLFDGGSTVTERDDVVDLTGCGPGVAHRVLAFPVPQFDGPAGGTGEQAGRFAHLHPPAGGEDDPFEVGLGEPGQKRARGDDRPVGQLADPAPE